MAQHVNVNCNENTLTCHIAVQRNACRGLMIVSCLLSGVALILNCMGMECVLLMKLSRETKEKLVRKSAVTWITAGEYIM